MDSNLAVDVVVHVFVDSVMPRLHESREVFPLRVRLSHDGDCHLNHRLDLSVRVNWFIKVFEHGPDSLLDSFHDTVRWRFVGPVCRHDSRWSRLA